MAKKPTPLKVYSVRLDYGAVEALKHRARERGFTVAMVIRSSIDDYLNNRDADDYLLAMEERLVATINRLNRTQLQTRRVADIGAAQGEYIRRRIDLFYTKRDPGDDLQEILAKQREAFMTWLPKALASTGIVRQMIRQVMDPPNLDSTPPEQPAPAPHEENTND